MTIKEQLAEKKAALVELEPQLKSDPTDEMIEQGETLVKEIADLEAKCAQAERAETLLKSIETVDETNNDNSEEKKMSQIEEFTQKAAEITDKKAGTRMHFEKAYNTVVTAPQIADVDRSIAPVGRRISAASLFQLRTTRSPRYPPASHLQHLLFPSSLHGSRKQTRSLQMLRSSLLSARTHLCTSSVRLRITMLSMQSDPQ